MTNHSLPKGDQVNSQKSITRCELEAGIGEAGSVGGGDIYIHGQNNFTHLGVKCRQSLSSSGQ